MKLYRKRVVSFNIRNGPATLKVTPFRVLSSLPLPTGGARQGAFPFVGCMGDIL